MSKYSAAAAAGWGVGGHTPSAPNHAPTPNLQPRDTCSKSNTTMYHDHLNPRNPH